MTNKLKIFFLAVLGVIVLSVPAMAAESEETLCNISIKGQASWLEEKSLFVSASASYIIFGKGEDEVTAIDALIEGVYYAVYDVDPNEANIESKKNIIKIMLGSTSYKTGVMDGIMGEYNTDNVVWSFREGETAGTSVTDFALLENMTLSFEQKMQEEETTQEVTTKEEVKNTKVKAPEIKKIKKYKKRKIKISIGKISEATGYQIKYSTSKRFKEPVVISSKERKCKTKKLYSGTYYLKARAYIEIDKIRYYSKWSKIETITI